MRLASSPTPAFTLASSLLLGCFSSAPTVGNDGGTTGTTDTDASSGGSSATSAADSSGTATGADTTTTDPATSSSSSVTTLDGTGSESTGGDASCECPDTATFCDGFEMEPGPWLLPAGGGGTEMWAMIDSPCGEQAMLTSVGDDQGQSFSVLVGSAQTNTANAVGSSMVAATRIRIGSGCAAQIEPIRIFEFRLPQEGGGQWYAWRVVLQGDQLGLSAANHAAQHQEFWSPVPEFDTWLEFRLHTSFTDTPPGAVLDIDGSEWVDGRSGAPGIAPDASNSRAMTELILGAFLEASTFSSVCTIEYDHVWLAPE